MPEILITVEGGRGAARGMWAHLDLEVVELPLPPIVKVVRLAEDALMRPFYSSCVGRLARIIEALLTCIRPVTRHRLRDLLSVLRVGILPHTWTQCAHFCGTNLPRLLTLPQMRRPLAPVRRHAASAPRPMPRGTSLLTLRSAIRTALPPALLIHVTVYVPIGLLHHLPSVNRLVASAIHLAIWSSSILRLPHSVLVHGSLESTDCAV